MRLLRALVALLLFVAVGIVLTRTMIPRLQCNLEKGRINRLVRRFNSTGDEYERNLRARRNAVTLRRCLAMFPEDYQLHMLLAANLRVLGDRDEAIASYKRALALTERPEIYALMGEIELERGNVDAARAALTRAATHHMIFIEGLDDPLRGEIYETVIARYRRLRGETDRTSPEPKRRPGVR